MEYAFGGDLSDADGSLVEDMRLWWALLVSAFGGRFW